MSSSRLLANDAMVCERSISTGSLDLPLLLTFDNANLNGRLLVLVSSEAPKNGMASHGFLICMTVCNKCVWYECSLRCHDPVLTGDVWDEAIEFQDLELRPT